MEWVITAPRVKFPDGHADQPKIPGREALDRIGIDADGEQHAGYKRKRLYFEAGGA